MRARGRGGLLLMSSGAALGGQPRLRIGVHLQRESVVIDGYQILRYLQGYGQVGEILATVDEIGVVATAGKGHVLSPLKGS